MSTSELHDLGSARYNTSTAAITDKDYALHPSSSTLTPQVLAARALAAGQAPKGYESKVHAWMTFASTTEEVEMPEELKGDLHGGQLHRENRAVREMESGGGGAGFGGARGGGYMGGGGGGRSRGGQRGAKVGELGAAAQLALCAGRKAEDGGPPMAKGVAGEMDKGMFWEESIV